MRNFVKRMIRLTVRLHRLFGARLVTERKIPRNFSVAVMSRATKNFNENGLNPFLPTVPTCAVRKTASLGIMGEPRVPPLNPSESIVLSEHYRL